MRLAAAVGLPVPAVFRLYVPEPVYIVERFDRLPPSGNLPETEQTTGVARRHVIDTCQLLNKSRSFKYTAAQIDTLQQAVLLCRSRAAARRQMFLWLLFNVLVGNGDNHLKNLSFTVDADGVDVAPLYDLLCTAVYDTRALADQKARWPATSLALPLGNAQTFGSVRRADLVAAGRSLGLAQPTIEREINRMLRQIQIAADKIIDEIEADEAAMPKHHGARELRLLRAIRKIVLAEMCRQLA